MKKAGNGGPIIIMSAVKAIVGSPEYAGYDASKGDVRSLTKAVALHCAEQNNGIRVNSIHPGYMMTDAGQSTGATSAEAVKEMMDIDCADGQRVGLLGCQVLRDTALFEAKVRFLTPLSRTASSSRSGMPQRQKPPQASRRPSLSRTSSATRASEYTLFKALLL
ncbi:hypothetical protein SPH9361_01875 [Sphingobium sp. CECT 9361]|nr:hypothetical protein SPH9361_01875 [Sphingobium sp. CECT 9361]